jgi:hypothetical protein
MAKRFLAAQPGKQDPVTVRQFRDIEAYLFELENRLAPLYGGGDVDPILNLDPVIWTLMALSNNTIPEIDGVFWASLRINMTGSTANASAQMRVTWGGIGDIPAGEEIGQLIDIGNNTSANITLGATIPIGVNVQFWVRGTDADVNGGRMNAFRIGTGDVLRGQV